MYLFNKLQNTIFLESSVSSASKIFVSKVSGQDGGGCGLHSKPCRSLSYALQHAHKGSTVYLNGEGTASSPYTCESFGAKQSKILLGKTVSVVGIGLRAHISCNKENIWRLNGTVDKNRVLFKNLAFQNTPIQLIDASLNVQDCVFNSTEEAAITISLFDQARFHLSLDSVVFVQNKACLLLTSKTNKRKKIFVSINNSTMKPNGPKNSNMSIREDSFLFINSSNDLINMTIINSAFVGNFFQTNLKNKIGDLIHVENKHGECNVLIENSQFRNNGLNANTLKTNNIFSVKSSILSVTVHSSSIANSRLRFLYFVGISSHINAHNTTFQNFSIAAKDSNNGGLFSVNALKTCHFFIKNCFVNKGEITAAIDGGVVYVDALNVNITIQSSFLGNIHTHGNGGVFYIKGVNARQSLPGSKLVFFAGDTKFNFNQVGGRGGVLFAPSRDITTLRLKNVSFVKNKSKLDGSTICVYGQPSFKKSYLLLDVVDTIFLKNSAVWMTGGAVYFDASGVTLVKFNGTSFIGNQAFRGGTIFARNTKSDLFNFIVTKTEFINNTANGNGGAINVVFGSEKSTIVLNRTIFMRNLAIGSRGGAVFIRTKQKHYANIHIVDSTFKDNSATYGGAISVPKNSKIMFICKDSVFRSNRAFSTGSIHPALIKFNSYYTSYGGAIFLLVSSSTIRFANTTFINNKCGANQGGAMYIQTSNSTIFEVSNSFFINNTAWNDLGGAIALVMSDDTIRNSGCLNPLQSVPPRSWTYLNRASLQNVIFTGNFASSGSALFVINGEIVIRNCAFKNNFAMAQAGDIRNDGSNSLAIYSTDFHQTSESTLIYKTKFQYTSFIQTFSGGPLVIRNSKFDRRITSNDNSLIVVTLGGTVYIDGLTSTLCPVGSKIIARDSSFSKTESADCNRHFSSLGLSCEQCESKYYSLERGSIRGLKKMKNITCNSCPRGADCLSTIKSKPNFWGYVKSYNPPKLAFTFCPVGYCTSPSAEAKGYNACHGHRKGVMCGSCSDDYTEKLFSTKCHLAADCNDYWFWVAFIAFVSVMASFLVFKPPVPSFLIKQIIWFKTVGSNRAVFLYNGDNSNPLATVDEDEYGTSNVSEPADESICRLPSRRNEQSQALGLIEIIFYYYQIAYLLLNSYWIEKFLSTNFIPTVLAFFNFHPSMSGKGLTCPFPGLTPLTKTVFEISPVFATLVAIWTIFGIRRIISFVRQRQASPHTFSLAPYLAATMETSLLGYAAIANVAFSLSRCVSLGSETRWFYNGNVECYQWWQYAAFVFNIVFVIPFVLTLGWASIKVQKGKITAKELLLASLLPLPLLFYWILRAVKSFRNHENEVQQPDASVHAMKLVLSEPFRKPSNKDMGAVYWQSILIARRFVLVLLYTFIADPTQRLFFMTLFNVLVLFHHVSVKPFQNSFANFLESVSLLILITLGLINMHKSVYVGVEANFEGELVQVFHAYDWFQIIVLGFLPAVLVFLILLGLLSLFVRILFLFYRFTWNIVRSCGSFWRTRDTTYTPLG